MNIRSLLQVHRGWYPLYHYDKDYAFWVRYRIFYPGSNTFDQVQVGYINEIKKSPIKYGRIICNGALIHP